MPRYIDAEKLKLSIIGLREDAIRNKREVQVWALNACDFMVETADTADVEEVKHGEWVEDFIIGEGVYRCTNCDDKFVTLEGTPYDNRLLYCPFCGAKMDGKEQTDDEL